MFSVFVVVVAVAAVMFFSNVFMARVEEDFKAVAVVADDEPYDYFS